MNPTPPLCQVLHQVSGRMYREGTCCKMVLAMAVSACALGVILAFVTGFAHLGAPGAATSVGLLMGGVGLLSVGICLKPSKRVVSNTIEMTTIPGDPDGVELHTLPNAPKFP